MNSLKGVKMRNPNTQKVKTRVKRNNSKIRLENRRLEKEMQQNLNLSGETVKLSRPQKQKKNNPALAAKVEAILERRKQRKQECSKSQSTKE